MTTTDARSVPFDPELAAALVVIREQMPAQLTPDLIAPMRAGGSDIFPVITDDELRRDGKFEVETRSVPGRDGDPDIELLICKPTGFAGTLGALYHTHGGGMIVGDNRSGLDGLLDWAEQFGLVLVSVEYRLAPETPHPGPVDDCYAGLVWTGEHAEELGFDPARLVVAGGSAGGGLAAAITLMARDLGGPPIAAQMLMCPMLDDRNNTVSAAQMEGQGVWDQTANRTGWGALLGDAAGGPDVSPYAAPARATDLSGLPPAFIDVGSAETFRDEDVAYASRIWQAGGQAELHVWPGGFHGFDAMVPSAAISQDAQQARLRWLNRILGA